MEVPRTMAGRLLRPVNGVNNVATWWGDVIVGTIPADGAKELNQNQIRHKNAVVKRQWDGPAYGVQCQMCRSAGSTPSNAEVLPPTVETS